MARSRAMITIFSKLAGSLFVSSNVVRSVTWPEALRLRDEKTIRMFCRHCRKESQTARCSNLGGHHFIGQMREKLTEDLNKPSTITLGEMLANAGLLGHSHTSHMTDQQRRMQETKGYASEDFIERAETKVAEWPLIGDTKAVRVVGVSQAELDRLIVARARRLGYAIVESAHAVA